MNSYMDCGIPVDPHQPLGGEDPGETSACHAFHQRHLRALIFSALHRLQNYLRSTMPQQRFNHVMLLHVHKEKVDTLDMKAVLNAFVGESQHRSTIFAKF